MKILALSGLLFSIQGLRIQNQWWDDGEFEEDDTAQWANREVNQANSPNAQQNQANI